MGKRFNYLLNKCHFSNFASSSLRFKIAYYTCILKNLHSITCYLLSRFPPWGPIRTHPHILTPPPPPIYLIYAIVEIFYKNSALIFLWFFCRCDCILLLDIFSRARLLLRNVSEVSNMVHGRLVWVYVIQKFYKLRRFFD